MRCTSFALSAFTANATAVYVLPVPAGPTANIISFVFISLTIFRWFAVRALMILPLLPNSMVWLSASSEAGVLLSIKSIFSTSFVDKLLYWLKCFTQSAQKASNFSRSAVWPSTFSVSPRAMSLSWGKCFLIAFRLALPAPSNSTGWLTSNWIISSCNYWRLKTEYRKSFFYFRLRKGINF